MWVDVHVKILSVIKIIAVIFIKDKWVMIFL